MSRAIAVVAAALVLFALLAAQVLGQGPLTAFDREVMLYLADRRVGWLTSLMLWTSEAHRTLGVLAATAAIAALLAWRGHARWAWSLGAVPSGMLLNVGLKQVFQRARPVLDEPLVQLATFSFPSGHGVASTVFYGSLSLLALAHLRRRGARAAAVGAAAAMIALVCFSRVYLGAHYLSDVVASLCIGVTWLVLWNAGVRRWVRQR